MAKKKKNTLTEKQEGACLMYIETGNKSEAYRRNYECDESKPETIWNEAYKLFNNPDVAARVEELKAEHAKRHNVTIDSITLELEQATNMAALTGNASAMTTAIMGKAKIHGLVTDKKVISNPDGSSITSIINFIPVSGSGD